MSATTYAKESIWLYYADVFGILGQMPVNDSPHEADCAIALSFGRNSIPDSRLPDVRHFYDDHKQGIETMDHISHPYFSGFDPGMPNHDIDLMAEVCIVTYSLPVIMQWEIAMSLYKQNGDAWVKNRFAHQELFCLWPHQQGGYRTIDVLEDAFKITQERGWKRPILLAHDYHMPRVAMLAQHFWPEFIIGFPTITCKFDPKSVQPMTTALSKWRLYECKSRAHHFINGWCFGRFNSGRW